MQHIGSRWWEKTNNAWSISLAMLLFVFFWPSCNSPEKNNNHKVIAIADSLLENQLFPLSEELLGYYKVEYGTINPNTDPVARNLAALVLFYHHRSSQQTDEALAFGASLLQTGSTLTDQQRANLYNDLGISYAMAEKYDSAAACITLAVPLLTALHDSQSLARSLNGLGNIHLLLKQRPVALQYYNQALTINAAIHNPHGMALNMLNIAFILEDNGHPDSAKRMLQKALPMASASGHKKLTADITNNLGSLFFSNKEYDSAYYYYSLSLGNMGLAPSHATLSFSINMAISNGYLGRIEQALDSLDKLIVRAKQWGFGSLMADACHKASQFSEINGNLPLALHYERMAGSVKDSLIEEENKSQMSKKLEEASLTEAEYKRQLDDKMALEKVKQSRNRLLVFILLTLVFSVFMVLVYRNQRLTFKKLQVVTSDLEEANENLKKISEIGQDIITRTDHYNIIEHLYLHLRNLLPVDVLAIGVYNPDNQMLEFNKAIEDKQTLPFFAYHLSETNSLATLCFNEQRRIVVDNLQWEAKQLLGEGVQMEAKAGRLSASVVYLPLTVNENQIGVFTVQSFLTEAYMPYHVSTLESIGAYLAIAMQNIINYESVKQQRDQLDYTIGKLRVNEKRLRETNAAKDRLFSIIAHDLKNPFSTILGFSDVLTKEWTSFDEATKQTFIKSISLASLSTYRLLENLLMWSRTQTDGLVFNPESIDLSNVALEAIKVIAGTAENKQITLLNQIPFNTMVVADENMIQTVLRNLLSNAVKFSHPASTVEVGAEKTETGCTVWVNDHGIGIAPEEIGKLFKVDQSIKRNGTHNETGSGLGLLLCKELISRHQGRIEVKSTPGKGSRFVFSIPTDIQPKPAQ